MSICIRSTRFILAVSAALFVCACARPTATKSLSDSNDLSHVLIDEAVDPARAALLIVRLEDGVQWTVGGARIEERFSPASTSKIPHTLVALETGFVEDADTAFEWDGIERSIQFWNRDQTLRTAFESSAVWVYQDIAAGLGRATLSDWINRFDYGNGDIGDEDDLTTYWVLGPLAISAREQVNFLTKLVRRDLPLSERTYDIALDVMQADKGEGWSLYAKTGWRSDGVNTDIGWYVGWLDSDSTGQKQTYVFAYNMDLLDPGEASKRIAVARAALIDIGALPAPDQN